MQGIPGFEHSRSFGSFYDLTKEFILWVTDIVVGIATADYVLCFTNSRFEGVRLFGFCLSGEMRACFLVLSFEALPAERRQKFEAPASSHKVARIMHVRFRRL